MEKRHFPPPCGSALVRDLVLILGMGSLGTSQGPQAQKKLYGSGLMKSHEWRTRHITQLIIKAHSVSVDLSIVLTNLAT